MRLATSVELSPTASSCERMSASRSSRALPTGPKTVLSSMTIKSRNSDAMIGKVRLKSKILPGSPAKEGSAIRAFDNTAASTGFAAFESSAFPLRGGNVASEFSVWIPHEHDCRAGE